MALLMIGVQNSKDKRAALQNGFWAVKAVLIAGIGVGAFFIPRGICFVFLFRFFPKVTNSSIFKVTD